MIAAIIAALVAIAVVFGVVVAVFALVSRRRGSSAPASKKHSVSSIQSIGVSSSMNSAQQAAASSHVRKDDSATPTPATNLHSRLVAMGAFAAAVFGALAAKAFSMQVLDSEKYADASDRNAYATVSTPAPRGYIYDADGIALVKNRSSLTVLADPDVADDHDTVSRLSAVLGVPYPVVRQRIQDQSAGAQSQRVVASDASLRNVAFISEHSDAFPGITVQTRTVREYPYGALAAHVLGYTSTATAANLETVREGRTIESGDEVGQSGVEATYDSVLAGDHGQRVVIADAKGNVREVVSETQPTKGSDVYLTIKAPVQYKVDSLLAELIAPDEGKIGSGTGTAGAVVVMDVRSGGIIAMSSYPTYEPSRFVGGISNDDWNLYNNNEGQLMFNRAISGAYPAASTYKAFTGMAGLKYGFATKAKTWVCEGSWDGFGSGDWQDCWLKTGHGELDLREGVVQSCDVVFYEIAKNFFDNRRSIGDEALQDEIKKYRFGQTTGIDISGEAAGRVPTPAWKAEYFKDTPEQAAWLGGDQTNMMIGQGYVLVTPLQIAVAYGAIATGKIVKPHLLKEVRNNTGNAAITHKTEVVSEPDIDKETLSFMRDALHGVGTENAEVANLFAQYGIDAAAKTGTAEVAGQEDYAWFTCYAPYDDPRYVVSLVIEQGGGGSSTAAPLGVEIMNAVFESEAGTIDSTIGAIAGSTGERVEYKGTGSGRTD